MICIVRVRGNIGIRSDVNEAMRLMHLTRVNHCVIEHMTPEMKGALQKVKDYVTWGEISTEALATLIERRGRLTGGRPITTEYLKTQGFDGFVSLAEALERGDVVWRKMDGVKPLFRLSPPRKGYRSTKRSFTEGGSLGKRDSIDDLIMRMV